MDEDDKVLHYLMVPEVALIVWLFATVSYSLLGGQTFVSSYARSLQVALWVFLALELLCPVAVYLDMRRRGDEIDVVWLHAVMLPLVNVFGLIGYLADRRRHRTD